MELNRIIATLKESDNVVIFPHISADGDAIGSCLALSAALNKLGKRTKVLLEEEAPYIYSFLPGIALTEVYTTSIAGFDTAVAIDTGDLGRLGLRRPVFESARITINIDHHNTNSEFGFYNYVDSKASAVGEIIYQIIKLMGLELDKNISTCLYVAITTDTGGFRYSNTTSLTHSIAADLINHGVSVAEVSQNVFDSTSLEKVKLTAAAIDSMELFEKGKVVFMSVTDEILKLNGAKDEDCDGIINTARSIRGVEVAALLRQWGNGEIKVNLRSNSNVDVSAIASLYSGGGHKKAAGYIVKRSMDDAKKRLLEDIREVL